MTTNSLDLNLYNPDLINCLDLDSNKKYKFLVVIDKKTKITDLEKIISVYLSNFNSEKDVSLILFLKNNSISLEESLFKLLERQMQFSAEIICLQEEIIPEPTFFAQLLKSCDCLIELSDLPQTEFIYLALAMNLQVIVSDGFDKSKLFTDITLSFANQSEQSLSDIMIRLSQSFNIINNPRSELLFFLSQASLDWSNDWLQENIQTAVSRFAEIQVSSVLFWGRSGSTFIHSLLDGHPEILSIGACNFASVMEYPHIWTMIVAQKPKTFSAIIDLFSHFLDSSVSFSIPKDFCMFSIKNKNFKALFVSFCHKLINEFAYQNKNELNLSDARKWFFIVIHFAYALALGQDVRKKRQIIHQLHWAEDLIGLYRLLEDFPDLKIIGMMRHPVQGFYSSLLHSVVEQQKIEPDFDFSEMVYSGFYGRKFRHILMGWRKAELLVKEPVFCIRLEKLHQEPQSVLMNLCHRLKIGWHDSLLESTQDGFPYEVKSGVHNIINQHKKVFEPERVAYEKWKEHIGEIEKFVLEGLLQKDLNKQGIESISDFQHYLSHLLLFLPTKIEKIAFIKALNPASPEKLKAVVLAILERYFFSWLFLCGNLFSVDHDFSVKKITESD